MRNPAPASTCVPPHPLRRVISRPELGLTRLSIITGVPVTSLSAMQCGRRPMSRRLLEALAGLGVNTDELIGSVARWRDDRAREALAAQHAPGVARTGR